MKTRVYFCRCGGLVSDKVDESAVRADVEALGDVEVVGIDFACGEEGQATIQADLAAGCADRCVIAACSPRAHEVTFRRVAERASFNPFFVQLANIREGVAWVAPDAASATRTATAVVRGMARRVVLHEPLTAKKIDVRTSVAVIGAGPAGLSAALTLAAAGRSVVLIEQLPFLGGLPVRFEDLFPSMECGACVLQPMIKDVTSAPEIEVLTLASVRQVKGSFGNFRLTIDRKPRGVALSSCIGCGECVPVCPARRPNTHYFGMGEVPAMSFAFDGAQPNAPVLDPEACVRSRGESCDACARACPVPDTVVFDAPPETLEREVGAVILAVGSSTYDLSALPALGWGRVPAVHAALEVEALLSTTGPTKGVLVGRDGRTPERVAFVHCAGSLDPEHKPYCSGICCGVALKQGRLVRKQLPDAKIVHFHKQLVVPGKEEFQLLDRARADGTRFVRYESLGDLAIEDDGHGGATIRSAEGVEPFDLVVLIPAIVPSPGAAGLAKTFDLGLDRQGFFDEYHGRIAQTRSKVRGIYLAGACQSPTAVAGAVNQGAAAAGQGLAALQPRRQLELDPAVAEVDASRCSGCASCIASCPFRAISRDPTRPVASIDPVLCVGCGICAATCPIGCITAHHFTSEQLLAELTEALS